MSISRYMFRAVLWALMAGLIVTPGSLVAIDCSVASSTFPPSNGDIFTLTGGASSSDLQTAIGYWGCSAHLDRIPTFQIGGSGGIPVSVTLINGNSTSPTGGCGLTQTNVQNGELIGAQITIWTNESTGSSCEPLSDSIAHEFGHIMGLADAPEPLGGCLGHIMGGRFGGGTRSVAEDDCYVADQMWHNSHEDEPNDPWCAAYGCSPILVDLDGDGFNLIGLDDPVAFDIHANGELDLLSWTRAGALDAFLALDRNGNGTIDDGSELFGDVTRLADGSRASNGYEALAELDSWGFGGNGDGRIDSLDVAFDSLRMWADLNHDGISQPQELQTLPEAGVWRIDLDYKSSHRRDRYGNEFRFLGRAWKENSRGVVHPVQTWDVFFRVAH